MISSPDACLQHYFVKYLENQAPWQNWIKLEQVSDLGHACCDRSQAHQEHVLLFETVPPLASEAIWLYWEVCGLNPQISFYFFIAENCVANTRELESVCHPHSDGKELTELPWGTKVSHGVDAAEDLRVSLIQMPFLSLSQRQHWGNLCTFFTLAGHFHLFS